MEVEEEEKEGEMKEQEQEEEEQEQGEKIHYVHTCVHPAKAYEDKSVIFSGLD